MEFKFREFDTHNLHNHLFSSSSSSLNYTYFSDQPIKHGIRSGRSVRSVDVQGGVGFPPPERLVLTRHRCEPVMILHDEPSLPRNVSVAMPVQARYGGGGYHHRDSWEFEAVPFRPLPPATKIKELVRYQLEEDMEKGKTIGLTASRSKRKPPPPTVAGLTGFCFNHSKKIIEEWRCAICDISVTSERGLVEHVAGKKHHAKVESLKCNNAGGDIGLGISKNTVKKQTSLKGNRTVGDTGPGMNLEKKQTPENKSVSVDSKRVKMIDGGSIRKKFKFWCKLCKTGAHDEKVLSEHKKGKKHLKNRRMKSRAKKRFSGRKSV